MCKNLVGIRVFTKLSPGVRRCVSNITAQYPESGNAILNFLHARLVGGTVDARGTMYAIGEGSSHCEVDASLKGISHADLRSMLRTAALPRSGSADDAGAGRHYL